MAVPDNKELEAIQKLRERLGDVLPEEELSDDYFLLRWIRAREMDLNKAEAMLRNAIKWRAENKIDGILDRKIDPFFFENYPRWCEGRDKCGRPLYLASVGKWDLRKVVREGRSQGFSEYCSEGFEILLYEIKESEKDRVKVEGDPPITQVVSIFDYAEFAWSQLLNYRAVQELLVLGGMYEAYYPEILHASYFINCPSLISKVLLLLKPILAPKTMAKITVLGTNKEEWQAELFKVIDPDQLRPEFGGTKGLIQDPDPKPTLNE